MLDILTPPEAVCVLALLMVGANEEIKMEEVDTMLSNPFFSEHVHEKIGDHKEFLKKYKEVKKAIGTTALEKKAVATLKSAFPALQLKTLALLMLIAEADDDFEQAEKELLARVSVALGVKVADVEPELAKMREAVLNQPDAEESEQVDNKTPKQS